MADKHKIVVTDSGGMKIGEIVNHTGFEWAKQKNTFGFFKINIPLDVPEAERNFILPIRNYIKYYRYGVLEWEGIVISKRYRVSGNDAMLEVAAVGLLFLLRKRYPLEKYYELQPAKDIIKDVLSVVNQEYDTKIQEGIIDVDVQHDMDVFNISAFEVLDYFNQMGYEYQIRSEDGNWYLDFRTSLGQEKIDEFGNPTYTLSNTNGKISSWEHEFDGTEYRNGQTSLGDGSGATQVRWSDFNADARSAYRLFEEIVNYPGIQSEFILSTFTARDLDIYSQPVEKFSIDIAEGQFDFDQLKIHDTVYVDLRRSNYQAQKFVQIDEIETSVSRTGMESVKISINVIL